MDSNLPNRLVFMQRIMDAAGHDYFWYVQGQVESVKVGPLEKKFSQLYDANLPKVKRSRRRRSGEAVTLLYTCPPRPYKDEGHAWMLLATAGLGRVHSREQMRDLRAERIELDGYELVHDGMRWSWKMTRDRYGYWRQRIHACATLPAGRRSISADADGQYDTEAEEIQSALYNAPGFRLVRRQVGELVVYFRAEWKRLRPAAGVQLRKHLRLPYVRRLPSR